jgi:hypothetical protein
MELTRRDATTAQRACQLGLKYLYAVINAKLRRGQDSTEALEAEVERIGDLEDRIGDWLDE